MCEKGERGDEEGMGWGWLSGEDEMVDAIWEAGAFMRLTEC